MVYEYVTFYSIETMKTKISLRVLNIDIKIYQTFYDKKHYSYLDEEFVALDVKGNPRPEHREVELLRQIYDNREFEVVDYLGLVSYKFGMKTRLTGVDFKSFINANPGYDVYFITPFPQSAYFSYNVWEQGEFWHPGLKELADKLFVAAGVPYSVASTGRNTLSTLLFSNFWVGNSRFWGKFGEVIKAMISAIDDMQLSEKNKYYSHTFHAGSNCEMFPFIFERLVSTMLKHDPDIKFLSYSYTTEDLLESCDSESERIIIQTMKCIIDGWDEGGEQGDQRAIFSVFNQQVNMYSKLFWDHHHYPYL